jgi:hypothetical protein
MSLYPGANIRDIKRAEMTVEMKRLQDSMVFKKTPLPEMAETAAERNIARFDREDMRTRWIKALKILYGE